MLLFLRKSAMALKSSLQNLSTSAILESANKNAPIIGVVIVCVGGLFFAGKLDAKVQTMKKDIAGFNSKLDKDIAGFNSKLDKDIAGLNSAIAALGAKVDSKLDRFDDILFDHHDRLARLEERAKNQKAKKTNPKSDE